MKNAILALVVIALGVVSCNKEPQQLSKQQIKHQIDSITQVRISESDIQARIDLERRIKIEVKAKADSIVEAQSRPKDTAAATHVLRSVPPVRPGMIPHVPGSRR
jgi:hypothetical protein